MFNLAGVLARFRRVDPSPPLQTSAEIRSGSPSYDKGQDFEAWQRHWAAIEQGIDELVAQLSRESRT
jgi:hypothetical protein